MKLRQRLRTLASIARAKRALRLAPGGRPSLAAQAHDLSAQDFGRMDDPALAAVWLGHATVLVHLGGKWVLIDPVFSKRVGPRIGPVIQFGPRRLFDSPVEIHELPPIDFILISHAHFDHLDARSLEVLKSKKTSVITALRTRSLIPRGYRQVVELGWDHSLTIDDLTFRAVEPRHWGARWYVDRHRGYNSYLVSSPTISCLLAADTAHTRTYDRLADEVPDLALGVFGIGAYDPWTHQHATPEEAWDMFAVSGARCMMPMHHSTFILSNEPIDEPLRRLYAAAGPEQAHRIVGVEPGEVWTSDGTPSPDATTTNTAAQPRE
ncbi:MAG: MBL fold metallo-hydrolase [Phycisphaerales bacterium]|jgi:L-ascorbate metabolism protein UlaG (beta-lactamase superfamily)|nr:MBL fold metallo-hydrolase [Phycisphaeraceae bacterium]